jgi:hypothetical protein
MFLPVEGSCQVKISCLVQEMHESIELSAASPTDYVSVRVALPGKMTRSMGPRGSGRLPSYELATLPDESSIIT